MPAERGQDMEKLTRDALLEHLKSCNPKTLTTFLQVIDGKVSEQDAAPFIREEASFIDEDMTTRRVTLLASRLCDCGKLVSSKNALKGKCQHRGCTRFVCAECCAVCWRCGRTLCPRHSKRHLDGDISCSGWCRTLKYLQKLFDIGKRRSDE